MKIGFVSAILDGWTFEEMMETAAGMGYQCVEAACWPDGKAERRYAGVSHIDVDNTSHGYVEHIKEISSRTGVAISALAYYPNTMGSSHCPSEEGHMFFPETGSGPGHNLHRKGTDKKCGGKP